MFVLCVSPTPTRSTDMARGCCSLSFFRQACLAIRETRERKRKYAPRLLSFLTYQDCLRGKSNSPCYEQNLPIYFVPCARLDNVLSCLLCLMGVSRCVRCRSAIIDAIARICVRSPLYYPVSYLCQMPLGGLFFHYFIFKSLYGR